MKRLNKSNKGFTLVEVIVVAVIVAVLAAVAIPLYIGYINDSAQNVVNNQAAGLSAAVTSAVNYGFNGTATVTPATTTTGITLTWPIAGFPSAVAFTNNVTYRLPLGVTADAQLTAANLKVTGVSCVLTLKNKTATASW